MRVQTSIHRFITLFVLPFLFFTLSEPLLSKAHVFDTSFIGSFFISKLAAQPAPEALTTSEQINDAVLTYLESFYTQAELSGTSFSRQVTISVSGIDPRLRLKACTIPLTLGMNRNQQPVGKISVKVQCRSSSYWSKLISAEVQVYEPVLVAARPIARGSIISSSDLETINMERSQKRNSYLQDKDRELVIGMQAKRNIAFRTPIALDSFKPQIMVKRGDTVVITAKSGAISIRQQGTALQDGEMGKQIDIRNSASGIVIQGVVIGQQQVKVLL